MACTKSVIEASRRYREKHPERHAKAVRRWQFENPDAVTAIRQRTYLKNRETRLAGQKEWYEKNKAKVREAMREKRLTQPDFFLFHSAKARAKRLALEFSIKKEDIVVPELCPILGIPLFDGTRKAHENAPSIDRIRNDLGYVPGNIAVISYRANRMKAFGTLKEFQAIVKYMETSL